MDEIWQRHKAFILQCAIGGILFLIAWGVKANMYDDTEQIQRTNNRLKNELGQMIADGNAPSRKSISDQQRLAANGVAQIEALARLVASVQPTKDRKIAYVEENVRWVLTVIGKESETARYVTLYQQLPQTCLFELKEEARGVLVGRAAELGKTIDETLGITTAFQDDEVPVGIHGLAIVCDLLSRALESHVDVGIDAVTDLRIAARSRRSRRPDEEAQGVVDFPVRFIVRGDPDDVMALLRSLNGTDNAVDRMSVLQSIDSISRERPEDDAVRVVFTLLGMHHVGIAGGE